MPVIACLADLVGAAGLFDALFAARDYANFNFNFTPYVVVAAYFVVLTVPLARFTDPEGQAIGTERCFLDAHAVDLGIALELAVIRNALNCESERLPEGRYLALNVSPAVLEHDDLAFEIGALVDDPLAMYACDLFTLPVNLAGLPGLSIPCGLSEGLPVGFQLVGPAFSENTLLAAGHALEHAFAFDPVPPRLDGAAS